MSSANGYLSVSKALITITDRQNNAAIRNLSSIDNLPKSQMRIICGKNVHSGKSEKHTCSV